MLLAADGFLGEDGCRGVFGLIWGDDDNNGDFGEALLCRLRRLLLPGTLSACIGPRPMEHDCSCVPFVFGDSLRASLSFSGELSNAPPRPQSPTPPPSPVPLPTSCLSKSNLVLNFVSSVPAPVQQCTTAVHKYTA